MAKTVWIPSSDSATLTTNYSGGAVPSSGDTLFFTDQSNAFPMLTNITTAFANKNIALVFERGFLSYAGTSANPMTGTGTHTWTQIIYEAGVAGSANKSYFSSAAGTTNIVVNTQSSQDDVCRFGGTISRLTLMSGRIALDAAATISSGSKISVKAASGAVLPYLAIPSGVTLTGAAICLNGGRVNCMASIPNVRIDAGDFELDGSDVDVTGAIEMYGGNFFWDAADITNTSTIALAEVFGGVFKTRKSRVGRTLSAGNSYGEGLFDFSLGGHNVTFSLPIRHYGTNPPRYPVGSSYTIGV